LLDIFNGRLDYNDIYRNIPIGRLHYLAEAQLDLMIEKQTRKQALLSEK
jgi:hypothetical protein